MFDLGLSELLLVGIVALIIVGPQDLPGMFRVVGKYVGRAKEMARDFQKSFEDAAKESGFDEVKRNFDTIKDFNPNTIAKKTLKSEEKKSDKKDIKQRESSNNLNEIKLTEDLKNQKLLNKKEKSPAVNKKTV